MEDEGGYVIPSSQEEEWDGLPLNVYEKVDLKVLTWSTGAPDFTLVDDLRLSFSLRDLGRPYVAARSIGGPVLLWWDVASARVAPPPASADVRLIRIPQPVKKLGGEDDRAGFEAALLYVEWLARSAREMKALLKLLRDGGDLDFIDQYRAFGHTFRPLLRQRFDEGSSGDTGRLRFSMKQFGKAGIRQKLTNAVAAIARDHLVIKPGPEPGSKMTNRKQVSEDRARARKKNNEKIKKIILRATTAAYKKFLKNFPPAEAESKLKGVVVIARIGKPARTFYSWLNRLGCTFEELKTEALRRARD